MRAQMANASRPGENAMDTMIVMTAVTRPQSYAEPIARVSLVVGLPALMDNASEPHGNVTETRTVLMAAMRVNVVGISYMTTVDVLY